MKTSRHTPASAFTLVELLTVMAVIAILAALVLGTYGYVQRKAATSRAEAEKQAMSAACESYKADNGEYPRGTVTDNLDAKTGPAPATYATANLVLYRALSGDTDLNRRLESNDGTLTISGSAVTPAPTSPEAPKRYFEFKPNMLAPSGSAATVSGSAAAVTSIVDPFGYSYGYSTANAKWQEGGATGTENGFNPTFDLWSTAGEKAKRPDDPNVATWQLRWIKNW